MAENINVNVKVNAKGALEQLKELGNWGKRITGVFKDLSSVSNMFSAAQKALGDKLLDIFSSFPDYVKSVGMLASDMLGYRNALQLVAGSQEEAQLALNRSIGIAQALSLDIGVLAKQYSKFMNAVTLAGVSTLQAEKIFLSFAKAARVLNLDARRTEGMFLAIEQMASKGTVSMEELRRQLGDHLPGALNLAAKAMGYTSSQIRDFIKQVSRGNVEAAELLPKLAELVEQKVDPLLPEAMKKFSAALQRAKNEITKFNISVGELLNMVSVPFLDAFSAAVSMLNDVFGINNSLAGSVEETKRVYKEIFDPINKVTKAFDAATESLEPMTTLLTLGKKELKEFGDNAETAADQVSTFSKVIGGIATLVGSLFALGLGIKVLKLLGKMVGWVAKQLKDGWKILKSFGKALFSLIGIFRAVGTAIMAHPIIASLVALAAALTYGVKKISEFNNTPVEPTVASREFQAQKNQIDDSIKNLSRYAEELDKMPGFKGVAEFDVKVSKPLNELNEAYDLMETLGDAINKAKVEMEKYDSIFGTLFMSEEEAAAQEKRIEHYNQLNARLKEISTNATHTALKTKGLKSEYEALKTAQEKATESMKEYVNNQLPVDKKKQELDLLRYEGLELEKMRFQYERLNELKRIESKEGVGSVAAVEFQKQTEALRPLVEEIYNVKEAKKQLEKQIKDNNNALSKVSNSVKNSLEARKAEVLELTKGKFALMAYEQSQENANLQTELAAIDISLLSNKEKKRVKELKKMTAEVIDFGQAALKIKKQKALKTIADDMKRITFEAKGIGVEYMQTALGDKLQKDAAAVQQFTDYITTLTEKQKEWIRITGEANPEISKLISELERGKQVQLDNLSETLEDIAKNGVQAFKDYGKEIDEVISKIKSMKSAAESNLEKIAELRRPQFDVNTVRDLEKIFDAARSAQLTGNYEEANKFVSEYIDGLKRLKEEGGINDLKFEASIDNIEQLATNIDNELDRIEQNAEIYVKTKMDQAEAQKEMENLQAFLQKMATENPITQKVLLSYARSAVDSAGSEDAADKYGSK